MLNHKLLNFVGNLPNAAPNRGDQEHPTNNDLLWSTCPHDKLCDNNFQIRQFFIHLILRITEMKTQNFLSLDFGQKQVSGIHFDLTGIELKEPPKSVCYGSLHQTKRYPFISHFLTIGTPHAMHKETKSARCCRFSLEDPHAHFLPGSIFHPNRKAVATGLTFVSVLCTQSQSQLPILMENNNKNYQITLPIGRIRFSSLDVSDNNKPKYQIRDPYGLTNAIISTNEQFNDCFLLHSTTPSQSSDELLQIVYGNENSILEQPNSIGHCISANAHMSKGIAQFLQENFPRSKRICRRTNLMNDHVFLFWDSSSRRYIYNFATKEKYSD